MHGFDVIGVHPINPLLLGIVVVWTLFWKGIALWRSAHEKEMYWFIAILVLNTLGILEIVYLFWFARKKLTVSEMKNWINFAKR